MADLNVAIKIAADDKASGPLGKVSKALGGLAGAPSRAVGGLVDGLGKLGLAGMGLGALVEGVGGLASGMVGGNAQMETYATQLGTLMGSADAAKDRLKELADFGAKTPFELPEIAAAEKVLLGFGLTGQKAIDLTGKSGAELRTVIGDIAAGTGASFEEIALNFGKFSAGATGESISRLQELGVVTREQMAGMGIEFSKSGELISPLPEAMRVAVEIANSKFGGGMDKLSATFAGQMSTLSDNFEQAKNAITQPIFDVLKEGLTSANEVIASGGFQAALKDVAQTMAVGVKQGVEFAKTAFEAMLPIAAQIQQWFVVVLPVLQEFGTAIGYVLGVAADIFKAVLAGDIPTAIELFQNELMEVVGNLGEIFAKWAQAFLDWVGPMIPPLLAQLFDLWVQMEGWMIGTALPAIKEQLVAWGAALVDWVGDAAPGLMTSLADLIVGFLDKLEAAGTDANEITESQWVDAMVDWVLTAIPHLIGKLSDFSVAFLAAMERIKVAVALAALRIGVSIGEEIGDALGRMLPQVWAAAQALGQQVIDGILASLAGLGASLQAAIGRAFASISMPSLQSIPMPNFQVPGHAAGTNFAPGGLSLVGERGPELVNLPRGSQVIPNHRLGTSSGGSEIDYDRLAAALSRIQLSVSVADVQAGLLRLQRRNVSTGIA